MENAAVNVTLNSLNGDLKDLVPFDASDDEIRSWVLEAVRSGSVNGIPADLNVNLDNFVIDRFAAFEDYPIPRIFVRPKTPYGIIE